MSSAGFVSIDLSAGFVSIDLSAGVPSSSSWGANSSFESPSCQAASTLSVAPSFAFAQYSSAAPSSSSESPSAFGASPSFSGIPHAELPIIPVSSSGFFRSPSSSGAFPTLGGSIAHSGVGFGATESSSTAATISATLVSSVASSGFDPRLSFGGIKTVNPASGMNVGIPLFNPFSPTTVADSTFAGSSAYSSSQSSVAPTTSFSSDKFPIAAIPSTTTSYLSTSQATNAVASPSLAAAMNPFSGFSSYSSTTLASKTASDAPITAVSRPQVSSSSVNGGSNFGSATATAVPTSSSLSNLTTFSHPSSIPAITTLASGSGKSFASSAPSASATASPAASSLFAFAASTVASSAASLTATLTTATSAAPASSSPATLTSGPLGHLSAVPTRIAIPPSEIVGKTVEEIVKEWTYELRDRTSNFRKQAESLGEWDGKILGNRNLLIMLESEVASVVESQHSVERQLELIDTHQQEVEKSLETVEEEVEKLYRTEQPGLLEDEAAASRDLMFEQAEFVDRELKRIAEQVKASIRSLNAVQGGDCDMAEGANPCDLVVRILNNQLTSLLWIDVKVGEFSGQLQSFADQSAVLEMGYSPRVI